MSTRQGQLKLAGNACLFALAACGTAAPPEAKTSDDKSASQVAHAGEGPCARERANAAELAQVAEAVAPPEMPPLNGKADSLAFIKGPMAAWIKARRAAVDKADDAHAAALACTPSSEHGALLLERGRLQSHLVKTFLSLGEAALPPGLVPTPEMKRAVIDSLVDAVKPQIERARSSFQQCATLGNKAATADVTACSSELAQLPQHDVPAVSDAGPPTPHPYLAYARPFVTTSQPKPCTFAGTLKLWRSALTIGTREVARIEQAELSRVTLPSVRSAPLVIETSWPIRGTFTLPASALPFNLRSRVDLVRGHVWLSEGAAVSAAAAPGGALAYRPVVEGADTKPDPAVKVACSQLELAGRVEPKEDESKRERINFAGPLTLSNAPGGPTIGTLTLGEPESFVLLESKNGWRHIQNLTTPFRGFEEQPLPYDVDAWTQSRPTEETSWGMVGLLNPPTAPTHWSSAELTVYADPSSAQPIGKLVKDVPLLLGETRGAYVTIIVPGLAASAPAQAGFWAEKSAVNASVRAL